jgi:hypothetical protein
MADIDDLKKQIEDLNRRVASLGGDFFKNIDQAIASFGGGVKGAEAALKSLNKEMNSLNTDVNYFYETLKKVTKELSGQTNFNRDITKSYSKLSSIANQLKYDQDGISELNQKDLISMGKKLEIEKKSLETSIDNNKKRQNEIISILRSKSERDKLNESQLRALRKEYEQVKEINKEAEKFYTDSEFGLEALIKASAERLKKEKDIAANLGLMGAAYKSISNTLQKMGVDSEIIKEMGEDLEKAAENGKVSFGNLYPIIKKGLTEALQDPLVRFTIGLKAVKSGFNDIKKAFNIFLEYDKIFVDTARNLGLSEEKISGIVVQAKAADTAIIGINGQTFDTIYTTAQLAKAFAEVNNQLGLSVDIGAKNLDEFTAMTNQMGLSADEATKLYKIGVLNNMSLEDTNKAIISGVIATQKSTGVQINARQVLQEIGKLSAGITTKFQQNPAALAQAVSQAKALGTNLEQVDKVGESILNFESSIENELKAELLTGKQINLEKARYAALTGDQATLTQELADQVGSLGEFQEMNVLAQKSLAEAFGLSRDEVADMLTKQETFNKLGDVSKKSAAEQLALAKERGLSETDSLVVNLKQQATSEKIAAAFDNFKSVIADVLIGLKPLLDMFTELSKQTWLVYGGLTLIAGLSLAKTIGGLVLMAAQLSFISAAKAAGATADSASAIAMGTQAVAAGTIAATESIITGEKVAQAAASSIINPISAAIGITLAAAAAAAIYGAVKKPKMAKGGIVVPTPGGTDVTVGEAGNAEAIIPLNSPKADEMLGIDKKNINTSLATSSPLIKENINNQVVPSPFINDSINRAPTPSLDLIPLVNAFNNFKNDVINVMNRPQPTPQFALNVDGRQIGTAIGKQMETGTSQTISTGYTIA